MQGWSSRCRSVPTLLAKAARASRRTAKEPSHGYRPIAQSRRPQEAVRKRHVGRSKWVIPQPTRQSFCRLVQKLEVLTELHRDQEMLNRCATDEEPPQAPVHPLVSGFSTNLPN